MFHHTVKRVSGSQNPSVYGGHRKFCVVCNSTSLLFCTISSEGELVTKFSVNSPSHRIIMEFMWHSTDPSIFFTQTNGGIITCHRINRAEKTVEMIGTIDIGENFKSFTLNSDGTMMVVVSDDAETARLYRLRQSEDGAMTFELDGSTGFDEIQITSVEFIRCNIIAYGLSDGSLHIEETGSDGRMIHIVPNLGKILAVRCSPNGNFFAVSAEDDLLIYKVDTKRFDFHLIREFFNDDEDDFYTKGSLEWHASLPLLVGTFVRESSGIYGMTKIMFLSVSDFGVEQLHTQKFERRSLCGIFIHPKLPLAICGYYGATKGEVLVWNFQDAVRFPLEKLLLVRNSLYQRDLPEDVIEQVLRETFGGHLSFQRFKHHCQIPLSASSGE